VPPGTAGESTGPDANGGDPRRPDASKLPKVNGTCPELKDGTMTLMGTSFELWVGSKPGPMYLYWHATTQHANEVERAFPKATADTKTKGGMVASFETTNSKGTNTGNNVWYTGDFEAADQIVACGIEKGLIDTSRIYTGGYSAGGIQACAMVTTHGAYLAAAICYSGSAAVLRGTPKDKGNLPPVLLPHGAPGSDVLILDMAQQSVAWEADYTAAGGFTIDCMDGGDHIASASTRMGLDGHAMEFLDAHPYGINPMPYAAGLPAGWPSYCKVVGP
jgi:dienelactone hydrolase